MNNREEFENSPRFKGMDFTRSVTNPEYYESIYVNGAWDGWKSSRDYLVIELPQLEKSQQWMNDFDDGAVSGKNAAIQIMKYRLVKARVRTK